ncbi:MAG: hypothetical protein HYX69_18660 [Planctomycetia bacterium]|nr:hypothetical protein [Planctomycetia bacterium]
MRHRPLAGTLSSGPALVRGRSIVPLRYRSRMRLFVDPARTGCLTLVPACRFARSSSQWLETSGNATGDALDFATGKKWSVEFWRNPDSLGLDRTYVCKYKYDTQRGWRIGTGGSTGQEHEIAIGLHDGSSFTFNTTTGASKNWSQCVVVFDLTQGTAANRVKVYLDGGTTPVAWSGTPNFQSAVASSAAAVTLGTWGTTGSAFNSQYYDGTLRAVRIWNRALASGEVSDLFSESTFGIRPALFGEIDGSLQSGCVAAWDLDEESGSRADSSGQGWTLVEKSGPIAQAQLCTQLVERAAGLVFDAPLYYYAPWRFASSPINGRPALYFGGTHWMNCNVALGTADSSGDILAIVRPTDLSGISFDYSFMAIEKDAASANETYFFPMFFRNGAGDTMKVNIRMRTDLASAFNGRVTGSTVTSAGSTYVCNVRGLGAGGTASWEMRVNGNQETVTDDGPAVRNKYTKDLDAPDHLTLGGLNYEGTITEAPYWIQDRFKGYIAGILLYGSAGTGGALSAAENLNVENWARNLAGV